MTRYAFIHTGEPVPKGRPRLGKGHAFTPSKTRKAERDLGFVARAACAFPIEGPVRLWCRFYTSTNRRGDLDNLVKLLSDACNGIAWVDDRQIVSLDAGVAVDRECPRIECRIEEMP